MKINIYTPLFIHELGQRSNQEDAVWPQSPTEASQLFVLCDGMGGHEHGEVASQTVSQSLGEWYSSNVTHSFEKEQVEDAIAFAYQKLDEKDSDALRKMGTTLTLLYLGNKGIVAAHMGDSRIYHIRPKEGILYQSRDHSLVFDLYQAGEITYDEMRNFAQKNIVTRAMTPGADNRMRPDIINITDIKAGDYFYMCSDGMLEQMNNDELLALFSSGISDKEIREKLIQATRNNQDNHSAWIIHVKDVTCENGDESLVNEEPIARCNAINMLPKVKSEEKVEEDDVVIVSKPSAKNKRGHKWIWIFVVFIAFAILIVGIWTLFFNKKEKQIEKQQVPTIQPIKPNPKNVSSKDLSEKYIIKQKQNNDTARNK